MKLGILAKEALDFAIDNEQQSIEFYTDLAARAPNPEMRSVFDSLILEERGHKAKLLSIKDGRQLLPAEQRVMDLKIGDYLEEVELSADLDYQQALVLAMKAEKAAFKLYNDLASVTDDPALKATLLELAQEEAKHKLRFEIEYDDEFLKGN